MRKQDSENMPIGVVPRRNVVSMTALMSDAIDPEVDTSHLAYRHAPALPPRSRWLPSVTAVTALAGLAALLEGLKLTR